MLSGAERFGNTEDEEHRSGYAVKISDAPTSSRFVVWVPLELVRPCSGMKKAGNVIFGDVFATDGRLRVATH